MTSGKRQRSLLKPGKSKYKRGFDADKIVYDKLSEFPFMALLFNGWGFGIEYNEPRGHAYMVIDQLDIAAGRVKAGGVCLTCKTPYAPKLEKEMGADYYKMPFKDVHAKIPEQFQKLGVACIDCHNNKDMSLKYREGLRLNAALKDMGVHRRNYPSGAEKPCLCPMPCDIQYH